MTGGYSCRPSRLPGHLVPAGQLPAYAGGQRLVMAAGVVMEKAAGAPQGLVPDVVRHGPDTVWVSEPGRGGHVPYRLEPEHLHALDGTVPGQSLVSVAPPRVVRQLVQIGVLVPRDATQRPAGNAQKYRMLGHAALPSVIHPFHLAELRAHYRRLIRRGEVQLGDRQSRERYVAHNEDVARFFHHRLATLVGEVAGRPVTPSYVYLAGYRNGAELPMHVDRAQCRHTLSVAVDYSPEPRGETPWPLELASPSRRIMAYQRLGDGLLFDGPRLPHARRPLPRGHSSTSLLFHYVDADFDGPLR